MIPKLSGLNCPSCGAALEIRSFGNALNVVCPNCLSVLDAKDPNLRILQEAKGREKVAPLIPLGTRGTLGGVIYEAIGFQVRTVTEEDGSYAWQEYLLFNPYRGFRYLTQYHGHWNLVRTLQSLPEPVSGRAVRWNGETYRRFSSAQAATSYVVGEFPWQVRVGETAQVADYVHVPRGIFSESTADETVWSLGEYITGEEVWKAFALPGAPPARFGVFENQPSPYTDTVAAMWMQGLKLLAAAVVVAFLFSAVSGRQVYRQSIQVSAGEVLTPPFAVGGHLSNLQIVTHNQTGERVFVTYSLIDQRGGPAHTFSRDVNREDKATISSIADGTYRLRVQPGRYPAQLDLQVRRGVPSMSFFWFTVVLLLLPPLLRTMRRYSFERERWQESGG